MTISAADDELPPGYDRAAPLVATEDVAPCPLCGDAAAEAFAEGYDYEMETCRNHWVFKRCQGCGCVWLDPRPAVSALSTIYPASYYSFNMEEVVSSVALKGKELLDRLKFKGILAALGRSPDSYLDIGCGDGRYLRLFEKRGIPRERIYGLEISEEPLQALRKDGFQVFCERVEACEDIPPESIDLATMFHVIEHVADPVAVVRRISQWLSPGGVLALETPNLSALDSRLFKKRWWGGYHIPRHWTLFDEASLSRLFAEAGLEVVATRYQTGHSFWMYSFHHALRYNKRLPSPGLARLFDPMRSLPVLIAWTGFDTLRRLLGLRTSAVLMLARKPMA